MQERESQKVTVAMLFSAHCSTTSYSFIEHYSRQRRIDEDTNAAFAGNCAFDCRSFVACASPTHPGSCVLQIYYVQHALLLVIQRDTTSR